MKNPLILIFLLIFMLFGCEEQSIPVEESSNVKDNAQFEQLKKENEQMKNQIAELEKLNNEEEEALRVTLNLAFQLFTAINKKDTDQITSISSANVQVNAEDSIIHFNNSSYDMNDQNYLLENLEYRFYELKEDKMTIGFANYYLEGHSTIYIDFVKQGGQWLLDYLVTDA
jgi:hypothetical protein